MHAEEPLRIEPLLQGLHRLPNDVAPAGEPILTAQLFFPGEERNASDGIYGDSLLMRI